MKGKYSKKKKKNTGFCWIFAVVILFILVIAALWIAAMAQEEPQLQPPETTQAPETSVQSSETESAPATDAPDETMSPVLPINLGCGVYLEQVNKYTGVYMEDGSDEMVSGIMMVRITNTGEDDIQLMHIEVAYPEANYYFQVTNLPAGSSAVLLEQSRQAMPGGDPLSAVASNVVLFQENMTVDTSVFEISGASGMMNVKNISGADIDGDIYVYYKYKTQDVFYGGITFRVTVQGGLKAGEIRQLMTSHFNPDTCQVVMVENVQRNGN